MFRSFTQGFPSQTPPSPSAGTHAKQKLSRVLLFGALLVAVSIAAHFFLPDLSPSSSPASHVFAETANVPSRTPAREGPTPIDLWSPGTMIAGLMLMSGIGLAVYLHRRSSSAESQAGFLHVVASYPLSADQKLQMVRCADDVLLLAVSRENITLLKTYPPETIETVSNGSAGNGKTTALPQAASPPSFAAILQRYASQYARRHTS